ncbi:MAG: hypothetical protein ACO277_08180 [Ilumatobacteraceae bacterium]
MASFVYNKAAQEMADGTIDLLTDTIKTMLVTSQYSAARTDLVVDNGGANDPVDAEINVTGYTRGWNGAGRKTLASKAVVVDQANNRAEFSAGNLTWTSLGTGATIAAMVLIKEGVSNDTTSRLIAYLDVTDTPTNGGNIAFTFDAEGVIQFSTV